MSNWTTKEIVKAKVQKWWDTGEVLACVGRNDQISSREIPVRAPTSQQISESFDDVRNWIADIKSLPDCRIIEEDRGHRLFGKNRFPYAIVFDTVDDIARFLKKETALAHFRQIVEWTSELQPQLLTYLVSKPMTALDLYDEWRDLLHVVKWMIEHPNPNVYIRAVDLPGIHTKFIGEHKAVLSELFDAVLPKEYINELYSGVKNFEMRYGFRSKPLLVRYKLLDDPARDLSLDSQSFAKLNPDVRHVFIVENEINFLAFPPVADSLVIFGAGYGFDILKSAEWLFICDVIYWGDIDTHGFAILNSLRKYLPHARSLMMDEQTVLEMRLHWGSEREPHASEFLPELSQTEMDVYLGLKTGRWAEQLRIEQEQIGWTYACTQIRAAIEGSGSGTILDRQSN